MAHEIRKAVIRRIAKHRHVSLPVAAYIYACKSIKEKQRLCEEEQRRQNQNAAASDPSPPNIDPRPEPLL